MDAPTERATSADGAQPTRRRVLGLAAVGAFAVATGEGVVGPLSTATAAPVPTVLVAAWQPPPAYDGVVGVL